jgi:hypothetical protein
MTTTIIIIRVKAGECSSMNPLVELVAAMVTIMAEGKDTVIVKDKDTDTNMNMGMDRATDMVTGGGITNMAVTGSAPMIQVMAGEEEVEGGRILISGIASEKATE